MLQENEATYNPYVVDSSQDSSCQLGTERVPNSILSLSTILILQKVNCHCVIRLNDTTETHQNLEKNREKLRASFIPFL